MTRHDDGIDAGRVGVSHAGTKVMRVLHTIKSQQQQGFASLQFFLDERPECCLIEDRTATHLGDHALVAAFAAYLGQPRPVRGLNFNARHRAPPFMTASTRGLAVWYSAYRRRTSTLPPASSCSTALKPVMYWPLLIAPISLALLNRPEIDSPGFHVYALHFDTHGIAETEGTTTTFTHESLRS